MLLQIMTILLVGDTLALVHVKATYHFFFFKKLGILSGSGILIRLNVRYDFHVNGRGVGIFVSLYVG